MEKGFERGGQAPIVGIDLTRFAAALSVVLFHYGFLSWHEQPSYSLGTRAAIGATVTFPEAVPATWWGWVGVQVFFVVSGFVIAMSAEGRSAGAFLRARVLRLAPALWFFATLALVATIAYASLPLSQIVPFYLRSLVLFPTGGWLDGVYWTLVVEVVFYGLVLLLSATGSLHRLEPVIRVWTAVSCLFWALCLAALFGLLPDHLSAVVDRAAVSYALRILLVSTGPYFIVGLVLYLIHRHGITRGRLAVLALATCAAEAGIYHYGAVTVAEHAVSASPLVPCLAWTAALVGMMAAIAQAETIQGWLSERSARRLRNLGLATYPLYLFHNISGAWLFGGMLSAGLPRYLALALAVAVAIGVSYLFAVRIEGMLRTRIAAVLDRITSSLASRVKGREWLSSINHPPRSFRERIAWPVRAAARRVRRVMPAPGFRRQHSPAIAEGRDPRPGQQVRPRFW